MQNILRILKLSTRYLSRSFLRLPKNVKMVAIHRVWKTKKYQYGTKWNATTSKFKMLNHNSNATKHLESQSGWKAIDEPFGDGGA